MSDLLYYYCGGGVDSVVELLLSLRSLLRRSPLPSFRIGIGLDRESANLIDWDLAARQYNLEVRIVSDDSELTDLGGARHKVNRWRALRQFDFNRVVILDIDTIVNRPLDRLFPAIHPDPEFFTTFVQYFDGGIIRPKHRRFYEAVTSDYSQTSLYIAVAVHAVRGQWPHFAEIIRILPIMIRERQLGGARRVFLEEYSLNLIALRNGRKVHHPFSAVRIAKRAPRTSPEQSPDIWHFALGRTACNEFWRAHRAAACEEDFLGIRGLLATATI